eukprot:2897576-Pyramimonas_sp.AAC.1
MECRESAPSQLNRFRMQRRKTRPKHCIFSRRLRGLKTMDGWRWRGSSSIIPPRSQSHRIGGLARATRM